MASAEALHSTIVLIFGALTVTVAYTVPIACSLMVMCSKLLLSWEVCSRMMHTLKASVAAMQQGLASVRQSVGTHSHAAEAPNSKVLQATHHCFALEYVYFCPVASAVT